MAKRLFIALLMSCCMGQSVAQSTADGLSLLQEKVGFVASFSQIKRISGAAMPLESKGYIIVDPEFGVQWKTQQPFEHSQCWLNNDSNIQSKIMLALIIGDLDQVSRYFSVHSTGNEAAWQVRLTPKQSDIKQFIDHIDIAQRDGVRYVNYWESAGHMTEMVFTKETSSSYVFECDNE